MKFAIGGGILLAILLLAQTVSTYFFVYDRVVADEAAREADRKQTLLAQRATAARADTPDQLEPLVKQFRREFPNQVAWIRIFGADAHVIAQAGEPQTKPLSESQLHHLLVMHQPQRHTVKSASGRVLVILSRARLFDPGHFPGPDGPRMGDPPPRPPRGAPNFEEIAIYLNGVTVNFGALRQNLIIGCMASFALLASMSMIGLLFNRFIRSRELEQQVELARTVQTDLLPSSVARKPSELLEFAAIFLPAATVGGDFYDVFTADDGRVSVILGDVAGKGISAAILMGVLHGAIRSMSWTRSLAGQAEASRRLNRFLCEKTARERFASLFSAFFVPDSAHDHRGTLCYVNAGHLPPLLVRASRGEGRRIERLECGGPVLGLLPSATYESAAIQVNAGDVLVVFSDGVAEATNHLDEEFGEGRIGEVVLRHIDQDPQQICNAVIEQVNRFLGRLKAHDDQTLLVVRLAPVRISGEKVAVRDSATIAL